MPRGCSLAAGSVVAIVALAGLIVVLLHLQWRSVLVASEVIACLPKAGNVSRPRRNFEYRFPAKDRRAYMAGGHTRVAVGSAATIAYFPMAATVSRMQQQKGIWGSIGEIGVYHGRFWISLALTAKVGEPLFVCDVFRKTEDNIDGSGFSPDGAAQLKTFLEHNAAFGIKESDLMLIEGSSLKLDFDLTRRANISCFRLISIDGGHTRNITASDLAFAACNLCQGGIVIVDDFYHYSWPGVQEGVHTYWSSPDVIELAPFMVAHNKLYLTTPESQPSYRDAMLGHPVWKKYLEISNPWSPLPYELNEYHIVQAEREPPAEELQELYMQEHDLPNN